MNIDALLSPISAESPCGGNLEYDDEFLALEQMLIEKPEQQFGDVLIPAEPPNWVEVEKQAVHLLSRSKDLRVIIALMQAWLNMRGLCGYADGLSLLRQILERYWEDVWPKLEFNGEYDHLLRLNTLAAIEDGAPCTIKAQHAIVLKSASTELSLLDACLLLNGTVTEIKGYTGGRTRLVVELKKLSNSSEIQAIITIRGQLTALIGIISHHLSNNHVPELPQFLKLLDTIIKFYPAHKPEIDIPENSDGTGTLESTPFIKQKTAPEQTTSITTTLETSEEEIFSHWHAVEASNRDDARILLEKAKIYFLKHEPSHPAPMMIDRILRLIDSDFIKIIYDLVPEGLNQIESIFGRPNNSDMD
ncbi:type VI secretion system protein TssA [Xenorhabdus anantnagensis]|uniref:Type VI secretion system protein TssA n=1 Tax=Xenorhabdus anantnagensis TaxID=3025875 RepID=A0ABT5LPJ1_9GAMM|nr:type VI secretion system protein TssA [Xenorhabdus anantnagensis]MDC9596159.1 type VI secretion system protein TssA [Xenorhabdus anantnagensis]